MKQHVIGLISILLTIFIFYSCSEPTEEKYENFTEKKSQSATERTVRDLTAADSLNITNVFDGSSLSQMRINDASIFAKKDDKIVTLNKQELSTDSTFLIARKLIPSLLLF